MSSELDSLREQIESYLKDERFVVFRGFPRLLQEPPTVDWDAEAYPKFEDFLAVPRKLGVQLITFHRTTLAGDDIDDLLDDIESAELGQEETAQLQTRLSKLRSWEGFTSSIELAFTHDGQRYCYKLRAEWYDELLDITAEIEDFIAEDDDLADMGGYFSRN